MANQQNTFDQGMTGAHDDSEEIRDDIAELVDEIRGLREDLRDSSPEGRGAVQGRRGRRRRRRRGGGGGGGNGDGDGDGGTPGLSIAGIELTQAIQYFRFNGQGSGFAADNTVPFVANKSLILRVYVDNSSLPQFNVTGTVSYAGRPDLSPINGPIPTRVSNTIDRGNANHTLNFRVPADHCTGSVTFTVEVFDPDRPDDPVFSSEPQTFTVNFESVPLVRIHGVLIHYTGLGLDIPAPSSSDLVRTMAWVGRVYPISAFNYTAVDVINFSGDLRVPGQGCGPGWGEIMNILRNMRGASGTNDVYVGLLPRGVPTGNVGGCGGGGVAVAYIGDGTTFAQEIGHAFNRQHAPCGNPGNVDPNYPVYGTYPSGSIGEFGFDNETSEVHNPASTFDFMSYCPSVWISPYTYIGLKNEIVASAAAALPDRPEIRDVEREYLQLNYRVHRDRGVELLPSFHLYRPSPTEEVGLPSPVSCDLLGAEGQLITTHRCHFSDPHQDPEGPYLDFHEVIPWEREVRSIAFRLHGEEVHTIEIEERPPEVNIQPPQREEREDLMRIEWEGQHPEKDVTYLLRYSPDGGNTWRAVAADLTEPNYVVDLGLLPGGDECKFQVLASAGLRTTTTETDPFSVPRKPRQPHILSPVPDATFTEGEPVVLLGGGFSPDFETPEFGDVVWTSNIDGIVGVGYEVITHTLSAGRHRITISIPDGLGGEASAGMYIEVRSSG